MTAVIEVAHVNKIVLDVNHFIRLVTGLGAVDVRTLYVIHSGERRVVNDMLVDELLVLDDVIDFIII